MEPLRTIRAGLTGLLIAATPIGALGATLYGIDIGSDPPSSGTTLVTIDGKEGTVTEVGNVGEPRMNALAADADGTLVGYGRSERRLQQLDKNTGAGTAFGGGFSDAIEGILGLAFDPDGKLFAVTDIEGVTGTSLRVLDPQNGTSSHRGRFESRTLRGLAFTPDGSLYGTDASRDRLLSIDPGNADTEVVMPLPNVTGLTAASNDVLFAIDNTANRLLRVDLGTETFTGVGDLGSPGFRGLALDPTPIPLPGALPLLLGALAWLGAWGRRAA